MKDTKEIVVQRATGADGPELLRLIRALAEYERLDPPDEAAQQRLVADLQSTPSKFDALIAYTDGRAAGYAIFFETYSTFLARPNLYLEDLFVLPDMRGAGIGAKLFRAVVAEAQHRGCGRMDWAVLDWNTPAIRFYENLGASHLKEWLTYRLRDDQFGTLGRPSGSFLP
jgi:GNAT superfamily N-acetyltransferase